MSICTCIHMHTHAYTHAYAHAHTQHTGATRPSHEATPQMMAGPVATTKPPPFAVRMDMHVHVHMRMDMRIGMHMRMRFEGGRVCVCGGGGRYWGYRRCLLSQGGLNSKLEP